MKKSVVFKVTILSLVSALLLTACKKDDSQELMDQEMRLLEQYLAQNNITVDPTESGLYYIPITEGTGMSPTIDTWVEIYYIGELLDGTVFTTSNKETAELNNIYDEGFLYGPSRIQLGNLSMEGLNEGIQYMKTGGKAKFIIPSSLALGGLSSVVIPAYSTLIYTIELLEAFDDPGQHEQEKTWAYLKAGSFENVDSTESGLYYIQDTAGIGELFIDGDDVIVTYTGKFLDGRVFDSNVGEDEYSFTVPGNYIIEGWMEGIKLMRDEEKGTLIIPYDLGYGPDGRYDNFGRTVIPPYMTLVYYMETYRAE